MDKNFTMRLIDMRPCLMDRALCLTKCKVDAEDVVQDVIYLALKNQDKYEERSQLKAWLMRILDNVWKNKLRKESKEKDDNLEDYGDTIEDIEMDEMEMLLDKLPEYMATTFKMYVEGWLYRDISEKLSVPIGTVKTRICRAKRFLQKIYCR